MGDSNMSLQIFPTIFDSSSSVDSDSSEEEDLQFLQFSWELENVFKCIEPECHPVHIGYMQTVATYSDREQGLLAPLSCNQINISNSYELLLVIIIY